MGNIEKDFMAELNPNTLGDIRKEFGFNCREDMDTAIDVLDSWVKQQNHFLKKDFKRHILEKFIITSKGSFEKAKKRIDKYCTVRTLLPKYFKDYDFENEFQDLKGLVFHCTPPKLTKDNYRIFIYKNIGQKFTDNYVLNYVRNFVLYGEYQQEHDYCAGYIALIDMRETNILALTSKLSIVDVQEGVSVVLEAYGFRIKSIHILSGSNMIDIMLAVVRPLLSKKINDRIYIHKNVEELYEFMPKEILPVNFGGKEKSVEELHDEWQEIFKSERETALRKEMSKAGSNENLRQRDKFVEEYMGTPGSFRSFQVD